MTNGYYRKPYQSGAARGLQEKMDYWKQKDFTYEFGVTLGMAMNLAGAKGELLPDAVFKYFDLALQLKASDRFRKRFTEYYETVNQLKEEQKRVETKKQTIFDKKEADFVIEAQNEDG